MIMPSQVLEKLRIDWLEQNNKKIIYIYKTYGINDFQYYKMLTHGCEICGRKTGRLCVDHIHVRNFKKMLPSEKRKYVRGLLCFMCNTALKGFEKTCDGKRNRLQLDGTYKYFQKYCLKGEK